MDADIPEYMTPVVALLRHAYPEGIPEAERIAVMGLLRDTGMSVRSVATAMGYYYGRPYVEFYLDAGVADVEANKMPEVKRVVLDRLRPFGYDRLLSED